MTEPSLTVPSKLSKNYSTNSDSTSNFEKQFSNLNLQSTNPRVFQTTINEEKLDEENIASLNDFHLAEIDLIECLARTNIMQRIKYNLNLNRLEANKN